MSDRSLFLYFDLEETLVESNLNRWAYVDILKPECAAAKKMLAKGFGKRSVDVRLFSFALANEHELADFNQGARKRVEEAIGSEFSMAPLVLGEIRAACCAHHRLQPTMVGHMEMIEFWGKVECFLMFAQAQHPEGDVDVYLVDDAVRYPKQQHTFFRNTGSLDVTIIHPDEMKKLAANLQ